MSFVWSVKDEQCEFTVNWHYTVYCNYVGDRMIGAYIISTYNNTKLSLFGSCLQAKKVALCVIV